MSVIKNALEEMESHMTPESIARSDKIYQEAVDKSTLYWGIFFEDFHFSRYSDVRKGKLENEVKDKHVTCGFKKGFPLKHRDGDEVKVHILGYGSDGINEGFLVEILDDEVNSHYQGAEQKHITLSLDHSGKAVNTANLKFEEFLVAYELTGVISSR